MFDFIGSIIDTLAGYLLDLFIWIFEFIFWVFDSILLFFWEILSSLLIAGLEAISGKMPPEIIDTIKGGYEWFQYINEWVPMTFVIKLFGAFFGIAIFLFAMRTVLAFLPWGGRKI